MRFNRNIITIIFILIGFSLKAQIFANSDFENGGAECNCANGYACYQDASRVINGREPIYVSGDKGCATLTEGRTNPLGAHSGTSYIYFYAGGDDLTTPRQNFSQCELVEVCVWYAGPTVAEATVEQDDSSIAFFTLAIDNLNTTNGDFAYESPKQKIPAGTVWTKYCYIFEVNTGNHNFGISSGQRGIYASWFDDFTVNYVDPKVDLIQNASNDTILCESETLKLNAAALSSPSATDSLTEHSKTSIPNEVTTIISPGLTKSFLWSTGSTDSVITINSPGTYWVKMSFGCEEAYDTINVIYDRPIIDFGTDTIICANETLTLDATITNATSYLWQDNSSNSSFSVNQPGNYWATTTTINNCITSDTINVTHHASSSINLGKDTILCLNDTITLNATLAGASSYLWSDNSVNPTLNTSEQGQYFVEIIDSNNCIVTDSILVDFHEDFIDLGNDSTLCQDQVLTFDVTIPNTSYLWQDNSTNPIYLIQENGTYWVEATNQCGMYSDTIVTKFENCDCFFHIPNSFTPNFDNINDEFIPKFDCEFSNYTFQIFNRWGELIFQTNTPKNSWDGTYKEQLCPTGVYVYAIQYEYETVYTKRHGIVNLIK